MQISWQHFQTTLFEFLRMNFTNYVFQIVSSGAGGRCSELRTLELSLAEIEQGRTNKGLQKRVDKS